MPLLLLGAVLTWSAARAGLDPGSFWNGAGWPQVRSFFSAMVRPDLSREMLELTFDAAMVTVGYAVVGTAVAIVIGFVGGIALTERVWSPIHGRMTGLGRAGWSIARGLFVVPRAMHEVVFGLILVNILGLDPWVAVLAIGIPFGAVTAKVFAELIDAVPRSAETTLRASGVGRVRALLVATVPHAATDLVSYAFYRFECSLRSAAVLGIVGAGGIGFELALSFQSLRYDQMWTLLWALVLLSGVADRWSSALRRRRDTAAVEMGTAGQRRAAGPSADRLVTLSVIAIGFAVPVSIWRLGLDPSSLWSQRARTLAGELVDDAWPPQVGAGGWSTLLSDAFDTIALAILAIGLAWVVASPIAFAARRPRRQRTGLNPRPIVAAVIRFLMLVARSVPPPVWAFIAVFVLLPGLWPGVVALALYNVGVLGRLQTEVVENEDPTPAATLAAIGASATGAAAFATVPAVASRFVGLGLYRWEVVIRETVIVGVVGAAGLGRRLDEQTSAFDYDGMTATILTLLVVTFAVDLVSASIRRRVS